MNKSKKPITIMSQMENAGKKISKATKNGAESLAKITKKVVPKKNPFAYGKDPKTGKKFQITP